MSIDIATLDRRRFLRGTGAALALPLLESFPALEATATTRADRKRFACVYWPDGVPMPLAKAAAVEGPPMHEFDATSASLAAHGPKRVAAASTAAWMASVLSTSPSAGAPARATCVETDR